MLKTVGIECYKYNFSFEKASKDHKNALIKLSSDETKLLILNIVDKNV